MPPIMLELWGGLASIVSSNQAAFYFVLRATCLLMHGSITQSCRMGTGSPVTLIQSCQFDRLEMEYRKQEPTLGWILSICDSQFCALVILLLLVLVLDLDFIRISGVICLSVSLLLSFFLTLYFPLTFQYLFHCTI